MFHKKCRGASCQTLFPAASVVTAWQSRAADSRACTAALMLSLVAMASWAQALCSAGTIGRRLTVAAPTAVGTFVLVLIFLFVALGASARNVAGTVVCAGAVASGTFVALQTLVSLLCGLLGDFGVNSSHAEAVSTCRPEKVRSDLETLGWKTLALPEAHLSDAMCRADSNANATFHRVNVFCKASRQQSKGYTEDGRSRDCQVFVAVPN